MEGLSESTVRGRIVRREEDEMRFKETGDIDDKKRPGTPRPTIGFKLIIGSFCDKTYNIIRVRPRLTSSSSWAIVIEVHIIIYPTLLVQRCIRHTVYDTAFM